jgi:carbon-monoxide dehydrogenase medium subunit
MWRITRFASAALSAGVAHADPAAEMPGIAVAAPPNSPCRPSGNGWFRRRRSSSGRSPPRSHLITRIRLPPWPSARRWGFQEFARRRGDFALAGVAAFYDLDSAGHATSTHIGVIGVDDRPRRLTAAEAVLNGRAVDANAITATAQMAAKVVDPPDDVHGTARYRRALLATLVERALTTPPPKRSTHHESCIRNQWTTG